MSKARTSKSTWTSILTDIFSKKKRSKIMKKIGPENSSYEVTVQEMVSSLRFKYSLHDKILPGAPDLVFPRRKKVVFVNGCFWHAHTGCRRSTLPTSNTLFWRKKILGNKKRDKSDHIKLRKRGWQYLVIWQCEIKKSNIDNLKAKIRSFLTSE